MADGVWPSELETAVWAGESEWWLLLEALPHIVWIARPDGWHQHFNQRWVDFTGLTVDESLGFGWNEVHPEDRERAAARWSQAISSGEPYEIEYRLRRSDGVYRWMLGRAMPLRDEAGTIVKWFGTCTDIEDLKQGQADLEQSRSLQRLAGSMARLGSWSLALADDRVVFSEEVHEILDWPAEVAADLDRLCELFPAWARSELTEAVDACATSGTGFDLELELETSTGRAVWVRVIGQAQVGDDGSIGHVLGALQDISALKRSSHQNEVLAQRLTTTLESITDAFFTVDRDWYMTYVNHRAEQMLRRSREELLGTGLWDAFPEAVGSILDEVYHRALRTGASEVIEEFYWAPQDIWLNIQVYPSKQGLAVYFRDVSDQRRGRQALQQMNAELNEANRQLQDAAGLKDDLLSMASHELRTPLTPILGFLHILEARADNLTADQHQMVRIISSNAKRMLRLVDDLLTVSYATAGALVSEPSTLSVQEVLLPVIEELGDALPELDLAVGGCQAVVDPQHLQQMVINLLTNAVKYGTVPITITASSAGPGRIVLEVADRGPGVDAEFRPHMWDRFVQKDRGNQRTATGVGLGLAIVKLLAEANGGTVSYRDASPSGAIFAIELPGSLEPVADSDAAGPERTIGDRIGRQETRRDHGPGAGGDVIPSTRWSPQRRAPQTATAVKVPPSSSPRSSVRVDPEQIVAWATRQLLHAESRDEAAGVVLRVVQRLGGWTTPARLADSQTLPLDVSFGISEPILVAAPPDSVERMYLERHLPGLVEDARRAVDVLASADRLQRDATIDPLTGLANRRGIDRSLSRDCTGATVVVLDLDRFKQLNDHEGHAVGDQILRQFATCLDSQVRAGDLAGRLGGDEFVAILWETDQEEANLLLTRFEQAWGRMRSHGVGFSAGVAHIGLGEEVAEVLARADAAMFVDKAIRHDARGPQ